VHARSRPAPGGASARAAALAAGDAARLDDLLHVDFRWTSHTGEDFDRAAYIKSDTGGGTQWLEQDYSREEAHDGSKQKAQQGREDVRRLRAPGLVHLTDDVLSMRSESARRSPRVTAAW